MSFARQDWYFDPSSFLPIRVVYRLPDVTNPGIQARAICDYLNFQSTTAGMLIPSQMRMYEAGQLAIMATIDSLQVNGVIEQGFDMDEGDN